MDNCCRTKVGLKTTNYIIGFLLFFVKLTCSNTDGAKNIDSGALTDRLDPT